MSVTGLQNVTNETATTGTFKNSEHGGNNRDLPAFPVVNVGNAWIPWADNGDQLKTHHFEIETGKGTKFVFQSGNSIWSADSADQKGFDSRISLFSKVGVSVNLTIDSDGTLTIAEV
ncbi:hypothetical protein [Microcystis sp. M061S2]|uniref:hypothetical protein n=1 Tax=Microcystis sp. M061S2 TaxID=2771171 RepID=UPI00258FBA3A|nr:hypothetical protein [Microcystis sp. M061S2]MCA2653941.1 hypothetical protein [Microcystis sp. M061S2]